MRCRTVSSGSCHNRVVVVVVMSDDDDDAVVTVVGTDTIVLVVKADTVYLVDDKDDKSNSIVAQASVVTLLLLLLARVDGACLFRSDCAGGCGLAVPASRENEGAGLVMVMHILLVECCRPDASSVAVVVVDDERPFFVLDHSVRMECVIGS